MREQAAVHSVEEIVRDLKDRRGLRQAWEGIDDAVQAEIKDLWYRIIAANIEAKVARQDEVIRLAKEVAMDAIEYHNRNGWEMAQKRAMALDDALAKLSEEAAKHE